MILCLMGHCMQGDISSMDLCVMVPTADLDGNRLVDAVYALGRCEDAVWLIRDQDLATLRRLKDACGRYALVMPDVMMGYKVMRAKNLPEDTIAFADREFAMRQGWIEWQDDMCWKCEYCGRGNNLRRCVGCGVLRDWADYGKA